MPSSKQLFIRPMSAVDIDDVLAIEQDSFLRPWQREHFEQEISALHSFPFVLVDGDKLAGYVCLMALFEEAQILDIAVAPDRRGKGIARLLMDHVLMFAREKGAETVELEVRSTNLPAILLYERLGFRRCGIRFRYYEGVDDALLMKRML